jgi:hypothetical protein
MISMVHHNLLECSLKVDSHWEIKLCNQIQIKWEEVQIQLFLQTTIYQRVKFMLEA